MIHTGAVESENRRAAAVLGVMHRHSANRGVHPAMVERVAAIPAIIDGTRDRSR
jgi:hypothetical protein